MDDGVESSGLARRELELVEALRDYLRDIEEAQSILFRIARRALATAIADLQPSLDPDS